MPTVSPESLRLTVAYEPGEDGWVIARIREVPAAMSQGRDEAEARANVLDALRELALSYLEVEDADPGPEARSEPLDVTVG